MKCPDERHERQGRGERAGPARGIRTSCLRDVLGRKRKKGGFRLPVWLAGRMVSAINQLKLLQEEQSEEMWTTWCQCSEQETNAADADSWAVAPKRTDRHLCVVWPCETGI